MMVFRHVGVMLLLAALLSGCTGGGSQDSGVHVVTDPDDFSYLDGNSSSQEHLHDYWRGGDMLQIADATFGCGGNLLNDPVICGLRPEDPIPLGTGRVEVTVDWTERSDQVSHYGATELWVKTAADNISHPVGPVEAGETVTLEVVNDQNDLPHQRISAWEFDLYVFGDDRDGLYPVQTMKRFHADVTMRITAYKTLEIPYFPGHPDIWQNRTEFALVTDHRYPADGDETRTPLGGTVVDDRRIRPDDGVVVPFDAMYVELVLESFGDDLSESLALTYHDATSHAFQAIDPVDVDGSRQVYHIFVDGGGDSPYALQSMWEFLPQYDDGPLPVGPYYNGYYTASATVFKDPPR